MPYPQQTDEQRRKMLAQELSHRGSGYIPTQEEINTSINVGLGRMPADVAYGEQGLKGGTEIGEIGGMPISATDVIPGGSLAKLAAMLKVGGTGLAALGGGMGIMSKIGAGSVPSRFGQTGGLIGKLPKLESLYHGTTKAAAKEIEKNGFDLSKSADGTVWFTSNPKIGEVSATGAGGIVKRSIDPSKLKLAGWDELDKHSVDELINMGYDGARLVDDGEITYQIFNPRKLIK